MMFQAQNREIINSTWKVVVSFKIIDNECDKTVFNNTKQHNTRPAKPRHILLVSDRSCPKTDGLRPHY